MINVMIDWFLFFLVLFFLFPGLVLFGTMMKASVHDTRQRSGVGKKMVT